METKKIGKIQSVSFGFGGYQDAMIGLSVTFGSDIGKWSCSDFKGFLGPHIQPVEGTKWTEAERRETYADVTVLIAKLLEQAKKERLGQLVGVPVEVTVEAEKLKSWRILVEAI